MSNVIAGFEITGVFPFNRYAFRAPDKSPKQKSLAERTGLKFIPMLTPVPSKRRSKTSTPKFTAEEILRYQKRLDEGYDLDIDQRYLQWKRIYHPDYTTSSSPPPTLQLSPESSTPPTPPPERVNLEDIPENQNLNDVATLRRPTLLSKLLSRSMPNLQPPTIKPKTSARVLTSAENLRILEEKKRKKDENEALKEERKRVREAKWLIKGTIRGSVIH